MTALHVHILLLSRRITREAGDQTRPKKGFENADVRKFRVFTRLRHQSRECVLHMHCSTKVMQICPWFSSSKLVPHPNPRQDHHLSKNPTSGWNVFFLELCAVCIWYSKNTVSPVTLSPKKQNELGPDQPAMPRNSRVAKWVLRDRHFLEFPLRTKHFQEGTANMYVRSKYPFLCKVDTLCFSVVLSLRKDKGQTVLSNFLPKDTKSFQFYDSQILAETEVNLPRHPISGRIKVIWDWNSLQDKDASRSVLFMALWSILWTFKVWTGEDFFENEVDLRVQETNSARVCFL